VTNTDVQLTATAAGTRLEIRVMPRAPRTMLDGVRDGRLVVRVTAAPVDQGANDAVITLLAKTLGLPRAALHLTGSQTHRNKTVEIAAPLDLVRKRLGSTMRANLG
jgi:uncharacterized protein